MVWYLWCFEDLEEKDCLVDQSISGGAVCRTAPATPGLLNMYINFLHFSSHISRLPLHFLEADFDIGLEA